jgi:DNA-binding response OmpR family regulator
MLMRVLVVEDEPLIATSIQWELVDAGHEVVGPAATLAEAELLATEEQPDLALVDINLAERGDGVVLARRLKTAGVPSIFVTGQINEARQARDCALGLLLKPFPFEALGRVVEAAASLVAGRAQVNTPRCLELFDGTEARSRFLA